MKILTVIGARPQFIKAAAVSRQLKATDNIEEVLVHTGQHFDSNMSEIFFEQMDIPVPVHNLEVSGLSHGTMTGRMMEKLDVTFDQEQPDVVMVYGDTNSTLAGALVAAKRHIPVAHVEAGLRSFNMEMPEEINRILTDRVSALLACPTDTAVENLVKEGYEHFGARIRKCGDVMQDAALYYAPKAIRPEALADNFCEQKFVLATIHRAENVDCEANLTECVGALNQINRRMPVVVPLHPRTKAAVEKLNLEVEFTVIDPVGYLEMIYLLQRCQIVLTDSGGLQKEAFFFGKPCITMREETEWVELVAIGCVVLTGCRKEAILEQFESHQHTIVTDETNLYGGGNAAQNIVHELASLAR